MRQDLSNSKPGWSGYTLDRLVQERAAAYGLIGAQKACIVLHGEQLNKAKPWMNRANFVRLFNLISYTDMIVAGVRLWRILRPLFRKK